VEATRASLVELMAEMEEKFPGSREKSVFASVELSLRRMSPANREKARVLGVFYGGVDLDVLRAMMKWEEADAASLAGELIETGLATPNRYNHLSLNPALCPYLRGRMDAGDREGLTARWVEEMRAYVGFLVQESSRNAELAAGLTGLELPNLFALLEQVERAGDAEATICLTTLLYRLLQWLGKPRLVERVGQVRDAAEGMLGEAQNHARFEAQRTRIEQQLGGGRLREAFEGAQELLRRARAVGEKAYPEADYDLAVACFLLARVLKTAGGSEQALPLLGEAQERFEAVERDWPGYGAEMMASACFAERGDCLRDLGRLDEAATAYEENIRRAEKLGHYRQVAVGKGQLGTVRIFQRRYKEGLEAYEKAREQFMRLDDPVSVANVWHQTGMVYEMTGQPEAAEDAYRKSLEIRERFGSFGEQASTLNQLGTLYDYVLGRKEEAAVFLRKAADKCSEIRDIAGEGMARSNLAECLRKLRRPDEARREIRRAIECKSQFGHAAVPWTAWGILANIETEDGNPGAAAEAKGKAIECYLSYRRAGGENHTGPGRLMFAMTEKLRAGGPAGAGAFLREVAAHPDAGQLDPFIRTLQAIVGGSRDRGLADGPELNYMMAAEILFLIETMGEGRKDER
jgi:tetratricopeptide (TPR) repeat protein